MRRSKDERRSNKFDIQGSDRNRDMDNSSPSVKKIDQIVAAPAENPLVGHCSYCNSSIWWKQGYMQEDDKFYHIRCLMMKSYDGKLAQQAETIRHLTKSLEEYRNSKGK